MQEQTSEALRAWFRQVEPIYPELFNAAHAMCANDDLAEYALRCAVLEVWMQNAGGGMPPASHCPTTPSARSSPGPASTRRPRTPSSPWLPRSPWRSSAR